MAPTSQRVEELEDALGNMELEDALGNMESKVSEMVSHAVEKAVGAMKQSLAELLLAGQAEQSRKQGVEIEAAVRRLEGRITEQQETMIYSIKSDLDQINRMIYSPRMNMEDSMAEDPAHSSNIPTVPVFGQALVSQSPPAFNFGPSIAASPFQFGGQQNQATPQNLPSFQTSNSLVNSGGSFSLGSGGVDRKMVRISKNKNRRK